MTLKGEVALVTGASRGIGKAIALALSREGAKVAVNYWRSEREAESLVKSIIAGGNEAVVVKANVGRKDQVLEMVETVRNTIGEIDILVNNAGVVKTRKNLEDITEKDWDEVMDINLKGTLFCCQAVIGHMKKREKGTIVNMSSIVAKTGGINSAASYAVSKAGVSVLTIQLAREVLPYRIRVNAIAPGGIDTSLMDIHGPQGRDNMAKLTPFGLGQPEDIAEAVAFLVSDKARFITGEILDINGGVLMD